MTITNKADAGGPPATGEAEATDELPINDALGDAGGGLSYLDSESAIKSVACERDRSDTDDLAICTAHVVQTASRGGPPTGEVEFVSGEATLAIVPLNASGKAILALPWGAVLAESCRSLPR